MKSMAPPRTIPPSPKVRLQNATVLAICTGVSPQCAYKRYRTAAPDTAANPRLCDSAYAQNEAKATRPYATLCPAYIVPSRS